jgi:hypothetical protein
MGPDERGVGWNSQNAINFLGGVLVVEAEWRFWVDGMGFCLFLRAFDDQSVTES